MALSADTDRDRACTGKARYLDRKAAKAGLKRLAHRNGEPLGAFDVFQCRWCHECWHIGRRAKALQGPVVAKKGEGDHEQ